MPQGLSLEYRLLLVCRLGISAFKLVFFLMLPATHSAESISTIFVLSFLIPVLTQVGALEIFYPFVRRFQTDARVSNLRMLGCHISLLLKAQSFCIPLYILCSWFFLEGHNVSLSGLLLFGALVALDTLLNDALRYVQIATPMLHLRLLILRQLVPFILYLVCAYILGPSIEIFLFLVFFFQILALLYFFMQFVGVGFSEFKKKYFRSLRLKIAPNQIGILTFRSMYNGTDRLIVSFWLESAIYNLYSLFAMFIQILQMAGQTLVIQPRLRAWYDRNEFQNPRLAVVVLNFLLCLAVFTVGSIYADFAEGYEFDWLLIWLILGGGFLVPIGYYSAWLYVWHCSVEVLKFHLFGVIGGLCAFVGCFFFDIFESYLLIQIMVQCLFIFLFQRGFLIELFRY